MMAKPVMAKPVMFAGPPPYLEQALHGGMLPAEENRGKQLPGNRGQSSQPAYTAYPPTHLTPPRANPCLM